MIKDELLCVMMCLVVQYLVEELSAATCVFVQYAIILIVLLLAEIALIIFAAVYTDTVCKLFVFTNLNNTQ